MNAKKIDCQQKSSPGAYETAQHTREFWMVRPRYKADQERMSDADRVTEDRIYKMRQR